MTVHAVAAIGEFGHVGAADENRTGSTQARHGWCIALGRWRVLEDDRAGAGGITLEVEQILYRDRDAGQRRGHDALLAQAIAGSRCCQRAVAMNLDESASALPGRISDTRKILTGKRLGRHGACRKGLRDIGKGFHGWQGMEDAVK